MTQEELKKYLSYDESTGIFTRIASPKQCFVGVPTGHHDKDGYLIIKIKQRAYKAHRLAWLYVYGSLPTQTIDHINGVRDDNRIINLRDVSLRENTHNRSEHRSGKEPCVAKMPSGKYIAKALINNKPTYIGSFVSMEEAQKAISVAELTNRKPKSDRDLKKERGIPNNIYETGNGHYIVMFVKNKVRTRYGRYKTLDEAKKRLAEVLEQYEKETT